jgi:glycosyltransferase involved in cell wall biosynthesis
MKVAMITSDRKRCGIATYSVALTKALRESIGIEVDTIPTGEPLSRSKEQTSRANAADLVHVQHEYGLWEGYRQRLYFKHLIASIEKPIVFTLHTTAPRLSDVGRFSRKELISRILAHSGRFADFSDIVAFIRERHCVVHTAAGKRSLVERGADPGLIHVKFHPAPLPVQAPSGGHLFRERFGLEKARIVSLFGFVSPRKGYEIAFQALRRLPPDVILVIAGGARTPETEGYLQDLRLRITSEGLERRVVITNFLSELEIADVMAASDVVVEPQIYLFGASGSVMVALSYGKAVLASDLDCFKEIQQTIPCMRLFRGGDVVEYEHALRGLLKDPTIRARMGQLALHYAAQNNWTDFARGTVEVYETALKQG